MAPETEKCGIRGKVAGGDKKGSELVLSQANGGD